MPSTTAFEPAGEPGETSFGERLLAFRLAAGLTQEELAEASGVSPRTISQLETGRRSAPQKGSATMLADALGLAGADRDAFFAVFRSARRSRLSPPADAPATSMATGMAAPTAAPDEILGRADDLAAIAAHFAAGDRLLTLLGPGGVGKSRLARAVADSRVAAWVDLTALTDPVLLIPTIARAIGAADASLAAIARTFGQTPPLLILDNFEHLIPAAADLPALLDAVPGLCVVVTSREPLRLAGERVLEVLPLAVPAERAAGPALAANPAVALFQRTLAAASTSQSPHPADLAAAAEIVTLLDGLPLAIELAAAQGVTLPVPAIAGLLRNAGLAALARGRRDGPARFQTMDAAIAWSTDLLPPDAQRLFRLLGVFRGGFTMDALIATVTALGDPALITALSTLAEAQLVQRDPATPGRMRMLEPVRMFATDRLAASGENGAVRRAHAAHYLPWAREQARLVAGGNPKPALDALDADLANLQIAFDTADDPASGLLDEALLTAARLSQYWELRLRGHEGRSMLERAVATALARRDRDPASVAPVPLMEAIHYSGYFAYMQGDGQAVRRAIGQLTPLVDEDASPEYRARLAILRILARETEGDPVASLLDDARAAHAIIDDGPWEIAWEQATQILANLMVECGDHEGALPILRSYADWAARRSAVLHQRGAAAWVGLVQLYLGQHDQARASFVEALGASVGSPDLAPIPWVVQGIAAACSQPGQAVADLRDAARLQGAFDALHLRIGFPLTPMQAGLREESREFLAAALGAAAFDALLAEGRDLPLNEALDLARTCGASVVR